MATPSVGGLLHAFGKKKLMHAERQLLSIRPGQGSATKSSLAFHLIGLQSLTTHSLPTLVVLSGHQEAPADA